MASELDHLRAMTRVVADTGDPGAVACLKPVDCTTNPTIDLKAVDTPACRMLSTKRWHGNEVRVATLYVSLPRLPTGSQSLLESSCCGLCRATCRLRWTATCPRTPQNWWRGATGSSTPTNRKPSGPSACSSNSYRRWEGPRHWLRETDCAPPHEQGKRSYTARRLFIGEAYDRTIHQIPRRLHWPPRRADQ